MLKICIKKLKKKIDNDIAADVAQWKRSNIKYYASAFSNILIDLAFFYLFLLSFFTITQ